MGCPQLWVSFHSFLGTPFLEDVPQPHLNCSQIAFRFQLQDFPISRMPGLPGWVLLKKELWISLLTTSFSGSFHPRRLKEEGRSEPSPAGSRGVASHQLRGLPGTIAVGVGKAEIAHTPPPSGKLKAPYSQIQTSLKAACTLLRDRTTGLGRNNPSAILGLEHLPGQLSPPGTRDGQTAL